MRSNSPPSPLVRAVGLGFTAGLRTFTPLAALTLRGRAFPGRPRRLLPVAAAGELIGDKVPAMPSRLSPPALAGRAASGALAGYTVAAKAGVIPGATAALAGAFAGQRARQALAERTGWPDLRCGLVEDAVAVTVAGVAAG